MNNNIIFPSSQVESQLPGYIVENYARFVEFMSKSAEAQERIGFGQDILQNLQKYRSFKTYNHHIVQSGVLRENITSESDELELVDGYGFPEENGVLLIDDEIILYRKKEGNFFYELHRGASGTTVLPTFTHVGTYKNTCPHEHLAGSEVHNLSVLFLVAMLDNIHKSFASGISADRICKDINNGTFLQNIRDFYQSKGTKLGISTLFKALFCENDVQVTYPGDDILVPSESTWDQNLICRVVPVSSVFYDPYEVVEDPTVLLGSKIEFRSYNDDKVYARSSVEYVTTYPWKSTSQFDLILNEDDFVGEIISNPSTKLTRIAYNYGTTTDYRDVETITVESTLGFPDSGYIFIENEAIRYTSKTFNQFLGCTRGSIGVSVQHEIGETVYGPYYITGEYFFGSERVNNSDPCNPEEITATSRSWPVGLVQSVKISDPGLLHNEDDEVIINGPGRVDPREVMLNSWIENFNDDLATQSVAPPAIGDIRYLTHGIDSVFFDGRYGYISGTNLPSGEIGPFSNGAVGADLYSDHAVHIIPRRDSIDTNENITSKGTDEIGLFIDGVPAFSNKSAVTVTQGKIGRFEITNPGGGYVNPSIVITPPNSEAIPLVENGKVIGVQQTSYGNYTEDPLVEVTSGRGAEISLTFDQFGRITSATIDNPGEYYYDTPVLAIVDSTGRGKGGLLACTVGFGALESVYIVSPGIDYRNGATEVEIIPVGSGAEILGRVESYTFDRYFEVIARPDTSLDNNSGFLFPDKADKLSRYGYMSAPSALRDSLGDDGTEHSPILGYAFDGNPIYGPYGYLNGVDGTTGRIIPSYLKAPNRSRIVPTNYSEEDQIGFNPPDEATYPMGTFVEDYKFISGLDGEGLATESSLYILTELGEFIVTDTMTSLFDSDLGTQYLDIFNGRVCNTPEYPVDQYPDGVYCYFTTVNESGDPLFPYILGETFHNRPISQNLTVIDEEELNPIVFGVEYDPQNFDDTPMSFDFGSVNRLRNPYLSVIDDVEDHVEIEVGTVTSGHISDIFIQNPGSGRTSPGDFLYFDNTDTFGGGAEAKVSWVKGECVLSAEGCVIETQLISHRQRINLSSSTGSDDLVFILGQFIETFGDEDDLNPHVPARARVEDWDYDNKILIVQTTSPNLFQLGDFFFDARGKAVQISPEGISGTEIYSLDPLYRIEHPVVFAENPGVIINNVAPELRPDETPIQVGDLWWSTTTGRLYIYYTDSQWIQTQPYGTRTIGNTASGSPLGAFGPQFVPDGRVTTDGQVIIAESAPSTRASGDPIMIGDLWWSSVTGILYIWSLDASPLSCVSCGCDDEGNEINLDPVWVITDPSACRPMDGSSDATLVTPGTNAPISSSTTNITISPTAPAGTLGSLWFSSLTGKMYVFYDGQWVPSNPVGMTTSVYSETPYYGPQGPQGPQIPGFGGSFFGPIGILPELENTQILFVTSPCDFYPGDAVRFGRVVSVREVSTVKRKNSDKPRHSLTFIRGPQSREVEDGTWFSNISRYKVIVETSLPHRLNDGDFIRVSSESSPGIDGVYTVKTDQCGDENTFFFFTDELYTDILDLRYETNAPQVESHVSEFKLTSGGISYKHLPVCPGIYKREIDRVQTAVTLNGSSIDTIEVTYGGSRYVDPKVIINGGIGAQATATVSDGVVTDIIVTDPGLEYENPQVILIEEGQFIPETTNIGKITSFNVLLPGRNISADKSLKPEILVETDFILEYPVPDVCSAILPIDLSTLTWTPGDEVYQGPQGNKEATALIKEWDVENQILTVNEIQGIFKEGQYVLDNNGNRAILRISGQSDQEVNISGTSKVQGRFITDKSFLSSTGSVIQDGYYYQLFSYVISSSMQRYEYESFVDNIVHPAGFIYFSESLIEDKVVTQCRSEDVVIEEKDRDIRPPVIPVDPTPPTNPRVGNLWYNPVAGDLYIFYFDGNSYQWIHTHPTQINN